MVTFFIFLNFLSQFSKFDAKGIKMIRMTKEIDLAQLVLCVSIGGPNMDFYLVLVRHVAQLHMTKQKHLFSAQIVTSELRMCSI